MIETWRLWLRAWRDEDANALHDILGHPEVMEHSEKGVLNKREQSEWLKTATAFETIDSTPLCFAVTRKQNNRCIGYVSLTRNKTRVGPNDLEIGFRFMKDVWNMGYATEATLALITAIKSDEKTQRIVAIVDPNNHRSVRVLKKLDMTLERGIMLDGYDYPDHFYSRDLAKRVLNLDAKRC